MNGYILLNKPHGISSFKALTQLKDSLCKKTGVPFKKIKLGHAGTLDPLAEGLLLVGVGKGTKMMPYLLTADKTYVAEIFLGKTSSTGDEEGEKVDSLQRDDIPNSNEIHAILNNFLGTIEQMPPVYSALKIDGKRACDRIRNGENVVLQSRQVEIFSLRVLHYSFPSLKIQVHCSSGTYIRTLAEDIGKSLQTGAYLSGLIRTQIGQHFLLSDAVTAQDVLEHDILKFSARHFNIPCIQVSKEIFQRLQDGQKVKTDTAQQFISDQERVMFVCEEKIFGIGEQKDGILIPRKNF